jgi:glycosyltransferase involved in cell wall biosynthesis
MPAGQAPGAGEAARLPLGDSAAAPAHSPAAIAPAAPKAIRVAWVAGPQTLSEYGRILQPLAVGLLDELVALAALCPQAANAERLPSPPVRILRYGRASRWAFWDAASTLRELAMQIASDRAQLLHALDMSAAPLAARLARQTSVPYAVSSYSRGDGWALSRLDPPPAMVLAASETVRQALWKHVHHGWAVEVLRPGAYQVKRASCFTQPQYSLTLVAGGRLDDAVAWRAVLNAFAMVARKEEDCAFFLLGSGPAERGLRTLARKLGFMGGDPGARAPAERPPVLALADWQERWQLDEILRAADLYVAPAEQKDLDVRCLLAMAAGVPVLTAGAGACDFLVEKQTARFFSRGDASGLAEGLFHFLEDRADARAQADAALACLHERHTPALMVAETVKAYRDLA